MYKLAVIISRKSKQLLWSCSWTAQWFNSACSSRWCQERPLISQRNINLIDFFKQVTWVGKKSKKWRARLYGICKDPWCLVEVIDGFSLAKGKNLREKLEPSSRLALEFSSLARLFVNNKKHSHFNSPKYFENKPSVNNMLYVNYLLASLCNLLYFTGSQITPQ